MIVVTGATGHIGNVLLRELVSQGESVRAIVLPGEDISSLAGLSVQLLTGDICDFEFLLTAFSGANTVYHLAGFISIVPGNRALLHSINVEGTKNVVEACLKTGVKRLVYTSSIHAVQEPPHGITIDESFPV